MSTPAPAYYTPGYSRAKALMVAWGLLLLAVGLWQLAPTLRLALFGERAEATATVVIKEKPGLPEMVLKDDHQVTAAQEPHDRDYIFWNEFVFHTRDNRAITVRAPIASKVKPLYSLLDSDGLPTVDIVYYDPAHPETVIFPDIISTWFIPGMFTFIGLVGTIIGSILFYWARRPIEMPHLPPPEPPQS